MNDSKIFILGANGQLGTALRKLYPGAKSADRDTLDMTNLSSVQSFNWSGIKVLINAAAYTNVDFAETPEGRKNAWEINATALTHLTSVARTNNITIVHISSDYVFDGTVDNHTESEPLTPLGVYAQTKAAGDLVVSTLPNHYIVRTSWVIGNGNNFVRTMQSLAERGVKPSVVSDQIGRLTFTDTLASGIKHLLDTQAPCSTYNLTNDGTPASWADIAKIVFEHTSKPASDVTPVTTAEYYSGKTGIAPRPLQSTLDLSKIKATGFTPEDWQYKIENFMKGAGE